VQDGGDRDRDAEPTAGDLLQGLGDGGEQEAIGCACGRRAGWGRDGLGTGAPGRRSEGAEGVDVAFALTGFPDGPPVKVGNSIADLVAGMSAAQGIVLALLAHKRTGRGQKVEIGMLDVMASLLTYQAGLYWNAGGRPGRRGNQHPSIVPYEVFRAQDAYLTLGVANNSLWERTCRALDQLDLARDPRFDTEANRVSNREVLVPLLNDLLSARPADAWLARFEEAGVPAGKIKTVAEVCESPHLKARGMVVKLPHPKAGTVTVMGVPVRLHATPGAASAPGRAHRRGAHASLADPEGQRREAPGEGGRVARGRAPAG
jgi:crotonobetainyl-CoA:carnitine CoA-transferase CaiB-like acyl-CoA transferase